MHFPLGAFSTILTVTSPCLSPYYLPQLLIAMAPSQTRTFAVPWTKGCAQWLSQTAWWPSRRPRLITLWPV
ncbi:hypothetical protein FB451DRAFT_1297705 [Mycena latifolia]|nr:hypothetical protein FB451DRAFT_1297705 [Mycena latifolia]